LRLSASKDGAPLFILEDPAPMYEPDAEEAGRLRVFVEMSECSDPAGCFAAVAVFERANDGIPETDVSKAPVVASGDNPKAAVPAVPAGKRAGRA
jgi:hypothetical protein